MSWRSGQWGCSGTGSAATGRGSWPTPAASSDSADPPSRSATSGVTQALAIADELGDPTVRGYCLLYLCLNRFGWMHQGECAAAGLESAELLRAAGDLWGVTSVLGFATIAVVDMGRFDEARRIQADLEPLCERLGNYPALMQARRIKAMVDFCTAPDLAGLEAFAHADVEFVRNRRLAVVRPRPRLARPGPLPGRDRDAARAPLQEGVDLDPPSALNGLNRVLLFEYLAYIGDREAALALLDTAEDNRMPVTGQPNGWGKWSMLLSAVEGLYMMGEHDRAADLYDLVVECIERTGAVCPNYNDMRLPERAAGIAAAGRCSGTTPRSTSAPPSGRPKISPTSRSRPTAAASSPACSSSATAPATGRRRRT